MDESHKAGYNACEGKGDGMVGVKTAKLRWGCRVGRCVG